MLLRKLLESDQELAEELQLQKDTHNLLGLGSQLAYKEKLKALDAKIEEEGTGCSSYAAFLESELDKDGSRYCTAELPLPLSGFVRNTILIVWWKESFLRIETGLRIELRAVRSNRLWLPIISSNMIRQSRFSDRFWKVIGKMNLPVFIWAFPFWQMIRLKKPSPIWDRFSTDDDYAGPASWYEALACLKVRGEAECQQKLQAIIDTGESFYAEKAKVLQQQLESGWRRIPGVK